MKTADIDTTYFSWYKFQFFLCKSPGSFLYLQMTSPFFLSLRQNCSKVSLDFVYGLRAIDIKLKLGHVLQAVHISEHSS